MARAGGKCGQRAARRHEDCSAGIRARPGSRGDRDFPADARSPRREVALRTSRRSRSCAATLPIFSSATCCCRVSTDSRSAGASRKTRRCSTFRCCCSRCASKARNTRLSRLKSVPIASSQRGPPSKISPTRSPMPHRAPARCACPHWCRSCWKSASRIAVASPTPGARSRNSKRPTSDSRPPSARRASAPSTNRVRARNSRRPSRSGSRSCRTAFANSKPRSSTWCRRSRRRAAPPTRRAPRWQSWRCSSRGSTKSRRRGSASRPPPRTPIASSRCCRCPRGSATWKPARCSSPTTPRRRCSASRPRSCAAARSPTCCPASSRPTISRGRRM